VAREEGEEAEEEEEEEEVEELEELARIVLLQGGPLPTTASRPALPGCPPRTSTTCSGARPSRPCWTRYGAVQVESS
jgi:hypothetical protein